MDDVWERAEPQSPCVRVCVVEPASRLCIGCLRTIDEIAAWGGMTAEARRAVMAELPGRAGQISVRRGGRRSRVAE